MIFILLLLIIIVIGVMYLITKIEFIDYPIIRFCATGVLNTINYYVLFRILSLTNDYLFSHVIAFLISAMISFFVTAKYTFMSKITFPKFLKFPLTFLPNLLISSIATYLIVENGLLSKEITSLIVMILIIPITFIINKLVFKK